MATYSYLHYSELQGKVPSPVTSLVLSSRPHRMFTQQRLRTCNSKNTIILNCAVYLPERLKNKLSYQAI